MIEKNGELFTAIGKIHGIKKPFRLRSQSDHIDDEVLGWVCSGSIPASKGFIERLSLDASRTRKEGEEELFNFDLIRKYYLEIWRDNLATIDNLFEVILIGAKSNYCYRFDPQPERPSYKPYPHSAVWGMGTGAKTAVDAAAEQYEDGLKGFLTALLKDKFSGGMFETWCLMRETDETTKEEKTTFQRISISDELTDAELIEALNTKDKEISVSQYVDRKLWTRLILAMADRDAEKLKAQQDSEPTERGDSSCQQSPTSKSTSRKSSRTPSAPSKKASSSSRKMQTNSGNGSKETTRSPSKKPLKSESSRTPTLPNSSTSKRPLRKKKSKARK